jgi:hypothetical protein
MSSGNEPTKPDSDSQTDLPEGSAGARPTREALVRGAGSRYGGLIPDAETQEVPVEAADGWDERIWHRGPTPPMGGGR